MHFPSPRLIEPYINLIGLNPINLYEFEKFAHMTLPRNSLDYYASGSNDMITLKDNRNAYSRIQLIPRILRDVSKINTTTNILGEAVSSPIAIAPTAMQQMAHADGEAATARAASR